MTRNRTRLKRIEAEVGALPLSPEQRVELEERLACRYTVLLDIDRRVAHRALELMGKSPGPYRPLRPTPEDVEKIREHERVWNLPRGSERSAEEARAYLGEDTPERALRDAELRAGSWGIWIRQEYVPTIEALRRGNRQQLLSLVFGRGQRGYEEALRRGETATFDQRRSEDRDG